MVELNFLKSISSTIANIGKGNAEFKQAATQQNNSISKFMKDVSKMFGSQAKTQGDINESLSGLSQSSVATSQSIQQNNSLLTQSISVQTQMLNELKEMSKNMQLLLNNESGEGSGGDSGGGLSQNIQAAIGAISGLGLAISGPLLGEIRRLIGGFDELTEQIPGSNATSDPINTDSGSRAGSAGITPVNATSERDGSAEESGVSNSIGSVSSKGNLKERKGFIIHHTGGRGDVGGVINTLNQRGLSVQYVIDREGQIHQLLPSGARASHMRSGQGVGEGLSNSNTEGVEIIAKDDSDILPVQVEAAKQLVAQLGYSPSQVYGHGEVNPHKQRTEGATVVSAIRGGSPPASPGESESATGSTGLTGESSSGGGGGGGIFDMLGPMTGDLSGILNMLGPAAGIGGSLIGAMNMLAGAGFSSLLGMIPGVGGLGAMNMMSGVGGGGEQSSGGGGQVGYSDTGGGGKLSVSEMTEIAKQAGFNDEQAAIMGAIGAAESGGNPKAHNPNANTGDNSYGLWQINMLGKMGPERRKEFGIESDEQLWDPKTNAIAAKKVFDQQGFNAWSVYKSGAYKQYLGTANKTNQQMANVQASDEREDVTAMQSPILKNSFAFTPVNASEADTVASQLEPSMPPQADYIQNTAMESEVSRSSQSSMPATQQAQSTEIPQRDQARVSSYSRQGSNLAKSQAWYERLSGGRMNYNNSMKLWPNVLA